MQRRLRGAIRPFAKLLRTLASTRCAYPTPWISMWIYPCGYPTPWSDGGDPPPHSQKILWGRRHYFRPTLASDQSAYLSTSTELWIERIGVLWNLLIGAMNGTQCGGGAFNIFSGCSRSAVDMATRQLSLDFIPSSEKRCTHLNGRLFAHSSRQNIPFIIIKGGSVAE